MILSRHQHKNLPLTLTSSIGLSTLSLEEMVKLLRGLLLPEATIFKSPATQVPGARAVEYDFYYARSPDRAERLSRADGPAALVREVSL